MSVTDRGFLCSAHDLKQKMLIDIWKLGKEEIVSLYCGSVMPKQKQQNLKISSSALLHVSC
ncbi:hypothetical protein C2H96_04105 [Bacillus subtilis]|nr:hypothetical protein C2H96_04105 [Bacillus subtilis]UQZ57991.1 hypothetical protein C2H93_05245 [Bacillus subtilis]UQZ67873.1 hypothetical protein C2H97_16160 [Bacillus subtilis PY79]UQZ72279.1 hypothetical protein C2I05_18125 [Bacillus subtilis]